MATGTNILDFNALADLYKRDPEAFKQYTRQLIDKEIEKASPELQSRLRGLQFTVDTTLSRCKDPVTRYNKMIELFWNGVQDLHDALEGKNPRSEINSPHSVLPFRGKGT